jgi:DNA-binding LacI/PurR family transcriptional regulator
VTDVATAADTAGVLRPPGMVDVARLAGVSHQTVSRVLNGHPNVRPETRDRVLAAIDTLGYRRNTAARALVTRRSHTIGALITGEAQFGPTSTLLALEEAARAAGYYLSLAVVRRPTEAAVARSLEHFLEQSVEGVVLIAPVRDAIAAARTVTVGVPVVMVAAGETSEPGRLVASVDQVLGAATATRHLLELGHEDVLHVAGPLDWVDARLRVQGWQQERARWGLPDAEPILADWSAQRGYEVGRALLARRRSPRAERTPPTGIFAANDQLALGLLRALNEAGVDVPGTVSIIGFDDIEGARYFTPPLTTMRQPFEHLGQTCMDLLLATLPDGPGPRAHPVPVPRPSDDAASVVSPVPRAAPIPPSLVVRASTGPPPAP